MKLALPKFQFRFIPKMGNVIFPGNFHPVGTQRAAEQMVDRALARGDGKLGAEAGAGGTWLVMGGSGGFGSAARVALGTRLGAHTLSLSYDQQPAPESGNKIRKIGSPGFHRNLAVERRLRGLGLTSVSRQADAFDPAAREETVKLLKDEFGGAKLSGLVWALAAPRGQDPRTGKVISSALKPLGGPATVKTFAGPDGDTPPKIVEFEIERGTPEEAVATQYVMGGRVVEQWIEALAEADALADGFTLLTISYRGNPLNSAIYRDGLIGLAKADLEFYTAAIDARLKEKVGGRAVAVEGPAVVTEASGGIPGVPLYMALALDVMGDAHEDPLDSMVRMVDENFAPGTEPGLDDEGLLRMDDRELAEDVQTKLRERFEALNVGDTFDPGLFERFMTEYARTRGFDVEGVDYDAEFDTDEICAE
jgi:enoyl-[acyl-carrier protein] reductase/trans-2-enoyl-CoA reductase (NAD+)